MTYVFDFCSDVGPLNFDELDINTQVTSHIQVVSQRCFVDKV